MGIATHNAWLYWSGDLALVSHFTFAGLVLVVGPIVDPRFVILLRSLRNTQGTVDPIERTIWVLVGVAITIMGGLLFINQLTQALACWPALGCGYSG